MTCAACPITVKRALSKVEGVTRVEISYERKEAVVAFDDARTTIKALTDATTDAAIRPRSSTDMSAAHNPFHVAASHIEQMRQATLYTEGALSVRTKILAALLWSVGMRCEPCVLHYARKAVEQGATKEELAEMLAVASTMGGCVGETWALKAFAGARAAADTGSVGEEACCTHS